MSDLKVRSWTISLPNPDGYEIRPFDDTFFIDRVVVLKDEADAEIERLRERDAQWAMDVLRLTESLRYLIGIAERGFGRKITDAETDREFVLSYVQGLEAEIERLRDLLREAHEKNVSVGWFQRVREALGDE